MEEQTTDTTVPSLDLKVQGLTLGTLTTNAKAILETVKVKLEGYKPENYSEDNIKDAKADKADLNTAAKKLNDERIRLEREFMKPFDEFKGIITETCALIKTASSQIDSVVKAVEDREKQEKRAKIEAIFTATGCQYFTLDAIFRADWLNKTTKLKDVEAQIQAKITQVEGDLSVLEKIGEPEARAYYLTTLDLHRAVEEAERIKANRERLAEIERAKNQPAPVKAPEPEPEQAPIPAPAPTPEPEPAPAAAPSNREQVIEVTLKFRGTVAKLNALKSFMFVNEIEYEKV